MNIKKTIATTTLLLAGMTSSFAHAQTTGEKPGAGELKTAQDQLAASFNGLKVSGFSESPVKGIYEIKTGSNILYFHPGDDEKKGILFFGEMFDSSGTNLTELSKREGLADLLKSIPLDSAITVGPKGAPVYYEITDPDCPYCHQYDQWLETFSKEHPVQRKLIFMLNPGHPLARAKIEHVICSKDKEQAVKYVFSSELPHNPDESDALLMAKQKSLKTCKEADEVIKKHADIIQSLGVNGTPSFLFNVDGKPELVIGFNRNKIQSSITKLETTAVTNKETAKQLPNK